MKRWIFVEVTKLMVIMAGIGWVPGEIIGPTSEASAVSRMMRCLGAGTHLKGQPPADLGLFVVHRNQNLSFMK